MIANNVRIQECAHSIMATKYIWNGLLEYQKKNVHIVYIVCNAIKQPINLEFKYLVNKL